MVPIAILVPALESIESTATKAYKFCILMGACSHMDVNITNAPIVCYVYVFSIRKTYLVKGTIFLNAWGWETINQNPRVHNSQN